jgi:5'-deoxynucleotidase YfbR-like HD superfamily hydrolase
MLQSMYDRVGRRADVYQQVLYLLGGGQVRRFHTTATLKDVTTGQHQYTTAWLCYLLADVPSLNLVMAALVHDTAEQVEGDIPMPTKMRLGLQGTVSKFEADMLCDNHMYFDRALTSAERRTLALANKLAGMLECVHERSLGNRYVELAFKHWLTHPA